MTTVALDSVPLPMAATSKEGYGSALRHVAGPTVVTSWIEGVSAFRLALVDTSTGRATVVKGARGLLRDAVVDAESGRAWLLCTYALHEVELDPFRTIRSVNKGVGQYSSTITALSSGLLLIGRPFGRSAVLVDPQTMAAVGRSTVPTPELAVRRDDGSTLLLTTTTGTVTVVDATGKRIGKPRSIPLGTTPTLLSDGRVAYLPGVKRPAAPDHPDVDPDRYAHVEPSGAVALLDPTSLTTTTAGTFPDIGSLGTCADDGHIVASTTTLCDARTSRRSACRHGAEKLSTRLQRSKCGRGRRRRGSAHRRPARTDRRDQMASFRSGLA